jgi:hypothetical protein
MFAEATAAWPFAAITLAAARLNEPYGADGAGRSRTAEVRRTSRARFTAPYRSCEQRKGDKGASANALTGRARAVLTFATIDFDLP